MTENEDWRRRLEAEKLLRQKIDSASSSDAEKPHPAPIPKPATPAGKPFAEKPKLPKLVEKPDTAEELKIVVTPDTKSATKTTKSTDPASKPTDAAAKPAASVKPTAQIGDVAKYRHQGKAIRDDDGSRLSEHEHVDAHVNLVMQTTNPDTGQTSYTRTTYRNSVTITIPRDMALVKTRADMELRNELREGLASGQPLSEELKQKLGPEAAAQRTIDARETVRQQRTEAGLSTEDLDLVTDEKIRAATYFQQNEVAEAHRGKPLPIEITDADLERILDSLDRMDDLSGREWSEQTAEPIVDSNNPTIASEKSAGVSTAEFQHDADPPPAPSKPIAESSGPTAANEATAAKMNADFQNNADPPPAPAQPIADSAGPTAASEALTADTIASFQESTTPPPAPTTTPTTATPNPASTSSTSTSAATNFGGTGSK